VVDVLTELHGVQSAGHQGFKKTWIRFSNGTVGIRQETTSRHDADSTTSVRKVGSRGQVIRTK
jgi:hypothetical protein